VRPHLDFIAQEGRINPREIKRYVNAYTVQTNIRPALNRNVVLALQTFEFHDEWTEVYDLILAEREVFTDAVRRQIGGEPDAIRDLWPDAATIPESLMQYLGSPSGSPLLNEPTLAPYINSIEATRSTRSRLIDLYPRFGRLRGLLRSLDDGADPKDVLDRFAGGLSEVRGLATQLLSGLPNSESFLRFTDDLQERTRATLEELTKSKGGPDPIPRWRPQAEDSLRQLFALLRQMRQVSGVGARSIS
jgi:hypothetical protein